MTSPALLAQHVGHEALTPTTAATVLALVVIAIVVAFVLDARAVRSEQVDPTRSKENRS